MLERLGRNADSILKILSLLFTLCLFVGSGVVYIYFRKAGIPREIYSILLSPQTLIAIAAFSSLLGLTVIGMIFLAPTFINFSENENGFTWHHQKSVRQKYIIRFLLLFIPLAAFLVLGSFGMKDFFSVFFLLLIALATTLFYISYGGPIADGWIEKFNDFFKIAIYLTIAYGSILFTFIFLIRIAAFLDHRTFYQWMLIIFLTIIYSALSAATNTRRYTSYIPLAVLSFCILFFIFLTDRVTTNIVTKLGIGNYSSSFSIDSKYVAIIDNDTLYKLNATKNDNVILISNIWVIATLPNKIILKASENSTEYFTVPITAIINEIGVTAPSEEQLKH